MRARARLAALALALALALRVASAARACDPPSIELNVGVGCDPSGFFNEALGLHAALRRANVCVRTPLLARCEPAMRASLTPDEAAMSRDAGRFQDDPADALSARAPDVDVRWHTGADAPCPWTAADARAAERSGTVAVLRSMTEKTTLTDAQLRCCALAHETWVPTEWHRAVYRRAGCGGDVGRVANIRALPEAVDEAVFAPTPRGPEGDPEEGPEGAANANPNAKRARSNANPNAKTPTTFLSVFQWQRRKGPDALLEAYWRAFGASDDVLLVIRAKVPRWAGEPFATARDGVRYHAKRLYPGKALSDLAPVETVEDLDSTRLEMAALYRAADAFALATRGEGWCLPCAEAMSSGALLIASDFSGVTAYADASNSLPVRCPPARGGSDLGGCDPDAEGLAWRMRWTHEHRADAAALARRGAEDVRRRFGLEAVGGTWRGEIARAVGEAARGRGGERRRGKAGLTDADDDG